MDGRPAFLSIQTSGERQLSSLGFTGPLSSSLPVLPSNMEQKLPNLPGSNQVSMERELMNESRIFVSSPLPSSSGIVGPMFSSSSGFSADLHFSSVSHEKFTKISHFITPPSSSGSSWPLLHSSHSEFFHSTASSPSAHGTSCFPLSTPSHTDFNHIATTSSAQNSQAQIVNEVGNSATPNEDLIKRNDWHEWADQLITDDEALSSSWNELLVDASIPEVEPKVLKQSEKDFIQETQGQKRLALISSGVNTVASPSSSSSVAPSSNKQRMRWTTELHEAFIEAVNKLGGGERATPKGVLKLMKVEGLTIYHVKSHLQKYRTARYSQDSSEGASQRKSSPLADMPPLDLKAGLDLTEALRLQMEVQKRLHEQLEIQRNLQLRIEEQGKYLQMMFQKQCQSGLSKLKAPSTSQEEEPCSQIPDELTTKTIPANDDDQVALLPAENQKPAEGESTSVKNTTRVAETVDQPACADDDSSGNVHPPKRVKFAGKHLSEE